MAVPLDADKHLATLCVGGKQACRRIARRAGVIPIRLAGMI